MCFKKPSSAVDTPGFPPAGGHRGLWLRLRTHYAPQAAAEPEDEAGAAASSSAAKGRRAEKKIIYTEMWAS
eukprot:4980969-Alexandrium_andersonii.AAC.1